MQRTGNDHPYDEERGYAAYCIAMFQRAFVQDDPRARAWMERHFRPTILGWLRRSTFSTLKRVGKGPGTAAPGEKVYQPNPRRSSGNALETVLARHPEEYYVSATFERLCSLAKQFSLQENELTTLLRYMQACLNAVTADVLREAKVSSLQEVDYADDWQGDSSALWEQLQRLLPDPREQRLAYLLYVCDLKPASIVQLFPQEFSTLEEISHLRCTLLNRLQQVKILRCAQDDSVV